MLSNKINGLITATISKISGITKPRRKFVTQLLMLYMGLRGRYTFTNLARYGKLNEKTYRNQFDKPFPWGDFNKDLIRSECSKELIAVFDPTFIPKSGKHTPHVDWHWSTTSQRIKRGIEMGSLAVVDVRNRTAFSLEARQTPVIKKGQDRDETLIDHYLGFVLEHSRTMNELGIRYHVADGYFTKEKYVRGITASGLDMIGKLRQDANLRYPFKGEQKPGRGRKRIYGAKVDLSYIDRRRIKLFMQGEDFCLFSGIVYSIRLKRLIRIVYIENYDNQGYESGYSVLFSTDLKQDPKKIYQYYSCRYQIEFLFRDAKQYVGMEECQARSENKINFHVNASLTTVSLAKAGTVLCTEEPDKEVFSMCDVKVLFFNKMLTEFIFSKLALDLSCKKYRSLFMECLDIGRLAS